MHLSPGPSLHRLGTLMPSLSILRIQSCCDLEELDLAHVVRLSCYYVTTTLTSTVVCSLT
jgi:hypothetical protein